MYYHRKKLKNAYSNKNIKRKEQRKSESSPDGTHQINEDSESVSESSCPGSDSNEPKNNKSELSESLSDESSSDEYISTSDDSISDSEVDTSGSSSDDDMNGSWETLYEESYTEEPLYKGSEIGIKLAYVLIVAFVLEHNLAKNAWTNLLRLICILLPKGHNCVSSVYKMKQFLANEFGTLNPVKIFYCSYCKDSVKDKKCKRKICRDKKAGVNYFIDLDLEQKLKEFFMDEEFLELMSKEYSKRINNLGNEGLADVWSGKDYKQFLKTGQFLSKKWNISFTLNTDGVHKYRSSSSGNIWPVFLCINELPKEYRYNKKYIIPALIYCDKQKPNMHTLLPPLFDKINKLNKDGFMVDTETHGKIHSHAMIFLATADLPAKADLMQMKQYNGEYSCNYCLDKGEKGKTVLHRIWPFTGDANHHRTHAEQLNYSARATQAKAAFGVKGTSVFAKLMHPFSLVWAFAIDWMHCICLGIVKTRFQSMVTEKGSTFYVGDQTRTLNDRLSSIKPPGRKIGRLPRETSELQHWKATEFKNWLIHYSLVVLHGILDHRYFLHWSLLVSSIGILTKDHISPGDLTLADEMLKDFCLLYPIFYGAYSCSMNFHLVRHLVYYVFRRGPLWAYSCFAFESLNAYIKGLVHGTHHAIDQITCALGLYYGLPGYAKKLSEMRNVPKKAKTLLLSLLSIKKDKKSKIVKIDAGFLSSRVSGDGTISQDVINSFKSYVEKFTL